MQKMNYLRLFFFFPRPSLEKKTYTYNTDLCAQGVCGLACQYTALFCKLCNVSLKTLTITLRILDENKGQPDVLNINCTDPLNRSALITAIENENMDLIQLLLKAGIKVKDALLHAIKEEYVEAVELLLEWEEKIHVQGEPYVSPLEPLSANRSRPL